MKQFPTPDPQQLAAIRHRNGPARIMAGAGSGKSTTMVLLVDSLIKEGVPASQIILTTFTRKGAESVQEKLEDMCGSLAKGVTVGTFHRIAAQEMIAYGGGIGNLRWHVLDEEDSEEFWIRAAREVSVAMLPKCFGADLFSGSKNVNKELEASIKGLWKPMREIRSFQVNMGRGSSDYGDFAAEHLQRRSGAYRQLMKHPSKPTLKHFFRSVLRTYEEMKDINRGRDYDDLLSGWHKLLRDDDAYRTKVRDRWRYVIVDEYQDTCICQDAIVELLNTTNLTVVGDIAQSIYQWRSAVPELMITFRSRYKATDYPLSYNYRSKDEILDVSNEVLRYHHDLICQRQAGADLPLLQLKGVRGPGGYVGMIAGKDHGNELEMVHFEIARLLRNGVLPEHIAVLCRVGYYSTPLEARLRAIKYNGANLPIQVWGGRSLLDSKTAKDLLAYFKLAARPGDEIPFIRLATLVAGVGEVAASTAFFRVLLNVPVKEELNPLLRTFAQIRRLTATKSVENFLTAVSLAAENLDALYEQDSRMQDMEKKSRRSELAAMKDGLFEAIRSNQRDGEVDLADIINQFSLEPRRDRNVPGALTIATVHAAKGLEWPHVFLIGANEGTLPVLRKQDQDAEVDDPSRRAAIEEECRICYVAMTRAKDSLTISFQQDKPSRFITQSSSTLANMASAAVEDLLATSY